MQARSGVWESVPVLMLTAAAIEQFTILTWQPNLFHSQC